MQDDGGPLVRPYFLTGGRSRPSRRNLELITLVVAVTRTVNEPVSPEYVEIMEICQQPASVAEVSAKLKVPLVVVKIMLSDLIERGYLMTGSPPVTSDIPSPELLKAVLYGLRRL